MASISEININFPQEEMGVHYNGIVHLAVAIVGSIYTREKGQRHTGIIVRNEEGSLLVVHLGWHNRFYCEEVKEQPYFLWVDCPGINEIVKETFVDWLLTSCEVNGSAIPYSFVYNGDPYFDYATGKYTRLADGEGLTCATFVIEAFRSFGLPIIESSTWPIRSDDAPWYKKIIKALIERTFPPVRDGHISFQKSKVSKVPRYRPEEVFAGAFYFEGSPVLYPVAKEGGVKVVKQMRKRKLL